MAKLSAQLLMERETRVQYGEVPRTLVGEPLGEMSWQLEGQSFLLRAVGDHYFLYRNGHGVMVERGPGADITEEGLWLNGSVYAAIASMNGLLPIHASAVEHEGKVYAFTGPSGAGKSTLIAALASRGLRMFCDDTLVLDVSRPGAITCLPGHKRLKLTPHALSMTDAARQEKVSLTVDKFYALPAAVGNGVPLPLGELIFLEEGPEPSITPIAGAERFVRIADDHHTAHLFADARRFDRPGEFKHRADLARLIKMARFARPMEEARFHEGVRLAADYVTKRSVDGE